MAMPVIIVADDDAAIRTVVTQALQRAGYGVRPAENAAKLWQWVAAGEGDLVVTDVVMPDQNAFDLLPRIRERRPDLPIVVMSAQNTFMTAIRASERGAYEYLPKPFDLQEMIQIIGRALAAKPAGAPKASAEVEDMPLIGRSPAMQDVYRVLARLMQTDLTVMVSGESGTGKELIARALHDYGKRKSKPFVAVNMAAIPRELIEAELFGHEKGAFTGAVQRGIGRFEQAQGGTLFLDEIGDMPIEAQTRLLRVLQQGEFTSIGGRAPVRTDVRIVAATNRDLKANVTSGSFREDLYFRLNVVPIRLPPLRDRRADIPDLAVHFLAIAATEGLPHKTIGREGMASLVAHAWPGNVRELENLMRRLAALCPEETLGAGVIEAELARDERPVAPAKQPGGNAPGATLSGDVALHLQRYFAEFGASLPPPGLYDRILRDVEEPLIAAALSATGGNQIKAAELLGLNRNTLRKKIRDLDIRVIRSIRPL